jgi:hypothetical protein
MGKILKSALWLLAIAVWGGLYKIATYLIEMQYAQIAPQQVDDDNAYTILRSHDTVMYIVNGIWLLVALYLIYRLLKTLFKNQMIEAKANE